MNLKISINFCVNVSWDLVGYLEYGFSVFEEITNLVFLWLIDSQSNLTVMVIVGLNTSDTN